MSGEVVVEQDDDGNDIDVVYRYITARVAV